MLRAKSTPILGATVGVTTIDLPPPNGNFTTMKKRKSPCIDVCEFSGPSGWCLGCGRTQEECVRWKKMKPYEANIIEKELKRRMAKLPQTPPMPK